MLLSKEGNNYKINLKTPFTENIINTNVINLCFDFAYQMAFGEGHHRAHRSGGNELRSPSEIFKNTFQGKIGETVLYNYMLGNDIICESVDYSVYGKGSWDDADLVYKNIKISVKSVAYFSNLLLLETKDWNSEGKYIPNINNPDVADIYDYFVLVRIKPNTNSLLFGSTDKETLKKEIESHEWFYDIAGCCSLKTLKFIIQNNYVLPQKALLNGKIEMDSENYYVQSGDLKSIDELLNILKNT